MDELDRMYQRLVQNIRAGFPDLLGRPFEVSLVYQQIIPYRLNRRELGLNSNDEYELTLLQLLSGARGLLSGDEEMQQALRAELESPNPDLGAYRAYATSTVQLNSGAVRALDSQPRVRSISPGVSAERPAAAAQAVLAARATEELTVPASTQSRINAPHPLASVAASKAPSASKAPTSASVGTAPKSASSAAAARPVPASGGSAASAPRKNPAPKPVADLHTNCRYCGGELPDARDLNFCPHCGQNLTIRQCPACSTELEVSWRYCVTCGRQVE